MMKQIPITVNVDKGEIIGNGNNICTLKATKYVLHNGKLQPLFESAILPRVTPQPIKTVRTVYPTENSLVNNSASINELGKKLLKETLDENIEEIKNLLEQGAPFTADWLGTNALHIAVQNNNLEICKLLLTAGISRDGRTKVDRTALHMAAYYGYLDIVETLVDNCADINCKDMLAMTPLHWAAQNGHYEVVDYLLSRGAQKAPINKFDLTPCNVAAQINRLDIVSLFDSYSEEPSAAAENLVLQLQNENESEQAPMFEESVDDPNEMCVSMEPILINDTDEYEETQQSEMVQQNYGDHRTESIDGEHLVQTLPRPDETNISTSAIKLLQQHGITMIPNDDERNILNSIVENGHAVVLTEAGKEILNSLKQSEQQEFQNKRIITLTPEEYLEMTSQDTAKPRIINNTKIVAARQPVIKKISKRIETTPVSTSTSISVQEDTAQFKKAETDMEKVMKQLIEAQKVIEQYKIKLRKSEQKAESYRLQLKLLMDQS